MLVRDQELFTESRDLYPLLRYDDITKLATMYTFSEVSIGKGMKSSLNENKLVSTPPVMGEAAKKAGFSGYDHSSRSQNL